MLYLEILAFITGLACVWYHRENKIIAYPIGIVNCFIMMAIFYEVNLHSDFLLQLYFIAVSLYGWYMWSQRNADGKENYPIRHMEKEDFLKALLIAAVGSMFLGANIDKVFAADAALPWFDATTTVLSMVAMVLMAKRYVEAWMMWVAVNILCIYNYTHQEIYVVAFQYILFGANSIWATIAWTKLARERKEVTA